MYTYHRIKQARYDFVDIEKEHHAVKHMTQYIAKRRI